MDFGLNDEHRAIVATVRDFVRKELVPHEDVIEQLDDVPKDLADQIRNRAITAGLYAANFPAELGGGGLDELSVTLVVRLCVVRKRPMPVSSTRFGFALGSSGSCCHCC